MMKGGKEKGWIYGVHSVRAVLEARPGDVRELLIAADGAGRGRRAQIAKTAAGRGIEVRGVSRSELDACTKSDSHQGVAAGAKLPSYVELAEIIDQPPCVLVVLDGVTDPHNLGAVARSAEALGASGLIVGKNRSAGICAAAHKASAGALEFIGVFQATNISRTLVELKDAGYWIYGADAAFGLELGSVDFSEKTCLVIGSEGRGSRPGVKKRLDFQIRIPPKGLTNSLNASVASAIILYEILNRQR